MLAWITANISTIFVTLLLILMVAGIVRSMIKDKKQGKSSCGGNCAHCKMCAGCKAAKNRSMSA